MIYRLFCRGCRWIFPALLFVLAGCAGFLPVPGGGEAVNRSFYAMPDDLLARLGNMHPGMNEADVYAALGRGKEDMIRLERNQIVTALYGSTSVEFRDGAPEHEEGSRFLQSLYGYRLYYKAVEREHGFSSPIRIRTDESGFDYAVTLIFREGILYERPIVAGGVVNRSSSHTFFDYISPGTVITKTVE